MSGLISCGGTPLIWDTASTRSAGTRRVCFHPVIAWTLIPNARARAAGGAFSKTRSSASMRRDGKAFLYRRQVVVDCPGARLPGDSRDA